MRDTEKSKETLLAELRSLRQQVADLEHRIQIGDIAPSITPREQAEEALRESHDLLRAVIEETPDMIPTPPATPSFVPQTIHRVRQRRLDRLIAHRQQRYKKGRQARY